MVAWVEVAGGLVIAAALAQAVTGARLMWRRERNEKARAVREAALFRDRADLILTAARRDADTASLTWESLTWVGLRKFVVDRIVEEAQGVKSFVLRPHDGQPLPPFLPGQFLTFSLRVPGRSRPVVRCYSLSDGPEVSGQYRVTIKRLEDGVVSRWFHDTLNEGDLVDVKAPSGQFHLRPGTAPVVLIGGGIGVTPVLSMAEHIAATGGSRECHIFVGARCAAEAFGVDRLRELEAAHSNIQVVVCHSRPAAGDSPVDHEGRVDVALLKAMLPDNRFEFYICGPAGMMHQMVADLGTWGVPKDDIHFEAFGPSSVGGGAPKAATPLAAPVEVVFARSGRSLSFTGEDENLLALADRHDLPMEAGCRAGNCGSCATAVLEGAVTYDTPPAEAPAPGSCLPCVGRPQGRLVLDA